jgi:hypothetical protein
MVEIQEEIVSSQGCGSVGSGSRDEPTVGATAALTTEQHLRQFYVELQAWIDGGCGKHPVFAPYRSICGAALEWQQVRLPDMEGMWTLWNAIGNQFVAAGLHEKHPFNEGSFKKWEFEADGGLTFNNPARLAWIREQATRDGAERVHTGPLSAASADQSSPPPSSSRGDQ